MASADIMPGFKACSLCTSVCYNTHSFDPASKTANDTQFTRPPCFLLTSVEGQKSWPPIPKEFVEVHGDSLRDSVNLEGPNGDVWLVEVGGPAKSVGFRDGWKAFFASTNLQRGDQLLFSLVAKNRFNVYILNRLGVEQTPSKVKYMKSHLPANGKRKREIVKEEVSDEGDDGSSESSDYEVSKSESEDSVSELEPEQDQVSSRPKREKLDNEEITLKANEPKLKKVTPKANSKTSHKKEALDSIKKECNLEPGWNSTTYSSRRREISEAERERTMKAALAFKTKNPSQYVLMKPSHVYRGFWLTIPGKFSHEHMPQERVPMKLQDQYGFQWPSQWIMSDHHSGISGGWRAFSCDHALEEADVCVFEVIDSEDWTILVHIFRVVEVDQVPGSRGNWDVTYNVVNGRGLKRGQNGQARPLVSRGKKNFVKKTSRNLVKKILTKALCKEVFKAKDSAKRQKKVSFADDANGDDETPLKNLSNVKSTLDTKGEEVDVKPKIGSMGLTSRPMTRSAAVKVKQENGTVVGDVKPTLEQLRASLKPARNSDVFQEFEEKPKVRFTPGIVKPEPMEAPAIKLEERTWYVVNRLITRRQRKTSSEKEFLVELEGAVVQKNPSGRAVQDESGHWWIPYAQFSPDFAKCFVD